MAWFAHDAGVFASAILAFSLMRLLPGRHQARRKRMSIRCRGFAPKLAGNGAARRRGLGAPARCRGVDALGDRFERDATLVQIVGDVDEMPQTACQSIETPDHQDIAFAGLIESFAEFGPIGSGAGSGFDEDALASRLSQRYAVVIWVIGRRCRVM
jgi:hypothetical protein